MVLRGSTQGRTFGESRIVEQPEVGRMFMRSSFWKLKREELRQRRNAVLAEHGERISDPLVESQLRIIDDEIEDCTRNIDGDGKSPVNGLPDTH